MTILIIFIVFIQVFSLGFLNKCFQIQVDLNTLKDLF